MAASEAAKEAIYLRNFLGELGCGSSEQTEPTAVSTDNTAARDISYNPEHHGRVKHIERRHFFVRERVENLEISVPFVRSEQNLADFFTKPLPAATFFRMRNAIMNVPPVCSTGVEARGGVESTFKTVSGSQVDTGSAPASL